MDGTLFTIGQFKNPTTMTSADYYSFLVANFGSLASTVNSTYPISAFNKTLFPPFYAISTVITDMDFLCPARRALRANNQSRTAAYAYLYDHDNDCP